MPPFFRQIYVVVDGQWLSNMGVHWLFIVSKLWYSACFDLYDLMLLDRGDGSKPLIDFIALIFYANGGMNIHEYSEYQPRVFNFGDVYQSTRVTQDFMLRGYSFITFRWWSFWSIAVVDLEVQMGWLWKKQDHCFPFWYHGYLSFKRWSDLYVLLSFFPNGRSSGISPTGPPKQLEAGPNTGMLAMHLGFRDD